MSCKLTVLLLTPGYTTPTVTHTYTVPNYSYTQVIKVERHDLGYHPGNRVYSLDVNGNQGNLRLATYYPGSINSSVISSSNSCLGNPNRYDCINAVCVPASEFPTPGLYQSLDECEQSCGVGCGGKCVSNEEWATIKGLASHIKNQNCR